MVAVKEKEVLFIPSHLQDGAVEFLGDFEKLHEGAEAGKVAVVDDDQEGHEHKADRKGHHYLTPYRGWKHSHRITIDGSSRRSPNKGGKGVPRRPFAGGTSRLIRSRIPGKALPSCQCSLKANS
jgi:hypothetical protein